MCSVREVLDQLNYRWHGRYPQIKGLLENLTENICGKKSLHVYGPAGTGKTGLLRDTLKSLGFCVARIGSLEVECSHPQLWHHIVNSWRRDIDEPEKRIPDDQEAHLAIEECRKRTGRPFCVIVDPIDSHVAAEWVSALLEFWERCPAPFTVIMVSLVPWLSVFGNSCPPEPRPHPIHFQKYSQEQIEVILRQQRPDFVPEQVYITLLRSFVRPQYHASALLTDAQTLISDLIEEALQADAPLTNTDAVMAHLQRARKRIAAGGFYEDLPGLSVDVCAASAPTGTNSEGVGSLELPRFTKLLLLAAHVASNNKPSADTKLFSTARSHKRRKDAMASDKQAMAAQRQMESEGQVFGTERWIQIFFKIVESDHNPSDDVMSGTDSLLRDMQSVTVLSQMKQLVSTKLVNQVITSKDAIEGISFTSNIPFELAECIAKSVSVNLQALLAFV